MWTTAERKVSGHCLLSKNFRAYAKYALISRLVLSLKNFAFVKRSGTMKAPVGLLSDRTVLRSKMEGPRPDKFRAGGDKSLYHPHAVLADTAVGGGYHAVGVFPVSALRLHQMEVVVAPAYINIRVAGVLLLGALVVGFDGADGRPLVLFEPQDSRLWSAAEQ